MLVLTEEVKRAEEQEVGDLVIEIVGKLTRIYEIVSTTRVKQIAYSDTVQGKRFLFFHTPANKVVPANDFTIARLYKRPEVARKIIGRLFPKRAAAGAQVHLYYAGKGPRGQSLGPGNGYFTVRLGMGIGEARAFGLPGQHTGAKAHAWFMKGHAAGFTGQAKSNLDKIKPPLSKKNRKAYETGYARGRRDRMQPESLDEARKRRREYKVGDLVKMVGGEMVGEVLRVKKGGDSSMPGSTQKLTIRWKGKYPSTNVRNNAQVEPAESVEEADTVKANILIDTVPGYQKGRRGSARRWQEGARKTFKNRKITNVKTVKLSGPGEVQVGMVKLNTLWIFVYQPTTGSPTTWKDVPFQEVDQATGKLKADPSMVLPEPRGTARSVVSQAAITRRRRKKRFEKKESVDEAKVTIFRAAKGYKLLARSVRRGGPPQAWWWTGVKWTPKQSDAVMYSQRQGAESALPNARAVMPGFLKERFDPQAAQDYVKSIADRRRRAYAREYLKAIKGIRMPPKPEDFKITTKDAKEVEAGFRRIGAPIAASVETPAVTFEQVARIVRRAKSAGFSPGRITLNEAGLGKPAEYLFLVHHDTDDTYSVALSVHDDPRLGYQELQTKLDKRDAEKVLRKLKSRWKQAKVMRFLMTGYGHKRQWLPESDEEKTQRIKDTVDRAVNDPANKGLTLVQVLRRIFKQDVNEADISKEKVSKLYGRLQKAALKLVDQRGKTSPIGIQITRQLAQVFGALKTHYPVTGSEAVQLFLDATNKAGFLSAFAVVSGLVRKYKLKTGYDGKVQLDSIPESLEERKRGFFPGRLAISSSKAHRALEKQKKDLVAALKRGDKNEAFIIRAAMSAVGKLGKVNAGRYIDQAEKEAGVSEDTTNLDEAMPSANDMKMAALALVKKLKGMAWEEMSGKEAFAFGKKFIKGKLPKLSDKQAEKMAQMTLMMFIGEDVETLLKPGEQVGDDEDPTGQATTNEARRKVFVKKEKEEVSYRRAREDVDGDERCGTCAFIVMPDACKRVAGKIDQDFTCDLWKKGVQEDLDEAGTQGKVQQLLLDFVKKLPRDSEVWLSDATKRREFRNIHFKRLMSAAKALEKKGLIWYDGMSAVGPVKA